MRTTDAPTGAAAAAPAGASTSSAAAPPAPPAARRWRRWGWTIAAVWLVFLTDPVAAALGNPDRMTGTTALVALAAFAVLYVWSLALRGRRRRDPWGWSAPMERRHGWGVLAVLAGLAALAFPGAGVDAAATFVFLSVFALFALPRAAGVSLALAVVAGCLVAPLVDPRLAELDSVALSTALASTTVFGVTATGRRGRQLAVAQQDLARLAVVEERGRVARDLHDLLGHSLTVVTLKAQLAGRLLEAGDDASRARAAAEVAEVERLSRDALADVRAALAGYREASLGTELAGARQALAAAGVAAHLPAAVDEQLPAELREVFAWAVREGVTNVVRHSGASTCWVELSPTELVVSDDGHGPAGGGCGSGLTGLAERARRAGAVLSTGRSSAGGFRLAVTAAGPGPGRADDGGGRA